MPKTLWQKLFASALPVGRQEAREKKTTFGASIEEPLFSAMRPSFLKRANEISRTFSPSGRALFYLFATLILISGSALIFILNQNFQITVPLQGGSFTEGEVGSPRFLNPILAISDADRDLNALIYSGLLKVNSDGEFIPDLASGYEISSDGRVYTVHIRPEAVFHDRVPLTAEDIVFTVERALDPAMKSPIRANWEGVSAVASDTHTVVFTLPSPYAPFVENLTMGILPKHLWKDVSAEEFPFSNFNTMPIGSGPYRVVGISRNSSGIPSGYELSAFTDYALGKPFISKVTLKFYQSEDALISALKSGEVDAGSGISPAALSELKNLNIITAPENRVFGVFFNQNQNEVLRDPAVRKALSDAVDREALVKVVLGGYGTPATEPIPPAMSTASSTGVGGIARAQERLAAAGWKKDESGILRKTGTGKNAKTQTLAFTVSTGNVPELSAAADFLKKTWESLGASVTVQVFNQGDLSQNVIRPRKYDALLFGEIVGRALDLFAFWHSSQRNDPGLNIALYANSTVDKALVQLRETQDEKQRQTLYAQFQTEVTKDAPAVFLYSPDFVYVFPKNIQGMKIGGIGNPSDRFQNIHQWYIATDHVWNFFVR